MTLDDWKRDRHQQGGTRLRAMMSAGVPRGGDGAGTLLAERRAAEALAEALAAFVAE